MQKLYVAYYRLSKVRKGVEQYGIPAQQSAVNSYLASVSGSTLLGEFVEHETGANDNRPELAKAIALAKAKRATLVIAKLDRLSRNALFLLKLQSEPNLDFLALDAVGFDKFTIGVLALFAQRERETISARTKAGLAVCKAQGKVLGNPRLSEARQSALVVVQEQRAAFAQQARKTLLEIQETGVTSYNKLAIYMTRRGEPTPRGGKAWNSTTVKRILTGTT